MIPVKNNIFGTELRQGLVKEFSYRKGGFAAAKNWADSALLGDAQVADGVLVLDGDGDYADCRLTDYVFNEFTVAVKVKSTLTSPAGYQDIVRKDPGGTRRYFLLRFTPSGYIQAGMGSTEVTPNISKIITTATAYNDGVFHDIVVLRGTENILRLYVDGTLEGSITCNTVVENSGRFLLGAYEGGTVISDFLQGSIEYVKIFNSAKTVSGAAADTPDYEFSDNTHFIAPVNWCGTELAGEAYSGRDGLHLNGSSSYAEVTDTAKYNFTGKMSALASIYADSLGAQKVIFSKWVTNGELSYIFDFNGNYLRLILSGDGSSTGGWQSDVALTCRQNYRVGFTYDGDTQTVKLYADGVEIPSSLAFGTIPGSIKVSASQFRIGVTTSGYFEGQINNIKLFNRVLPANLIW
jgi:hypothetical protein